MRPADTSPEAWDFYCRRLAELTPADRIGIAMELWRAADCFQRAAIREEHPEYDESEVAFCLAVRRYGEELARKAFLR